MILLMQIDCKIIREAALDSFPRVLKREKKMLITSMKPCEMNIKFYACKTSTYPQFLFFVGTGGWTVVYPANECS